MSHKHRLKFVRSGVEFVGFEGVPYIRTWEFKCAYLTCAYTKRVDRECWRNRLVGRHGILEWTFHESWAA